MKLLKKHKARLACTVRRLHVPLKDKESCDQGFRATTGRIYIDSKTRYLPSLDAGDNQLSQAGWRDRNDEEQLCQARKRKKALQQKCLFSFLSGAPETMKRGTGYHAFRFLGNFLTLA